MHTRAYIIYIYIYILVYETEVGSRGALIRCKVYVCSAATWIDRTGERRKDRRYRQVDRERQRRERKGLAEGWNELFKGCPQGRNENNSTPDDAKEEVEIERTGRTGRVVRLYYSFLTQM